MGGYITKFRVWGCPGLRVWGSLGLPLDSRESRNGKEHGHIVFLGKIGGGYFRGPFLHAC